MSLDSGELQPGGTIDHYRLERTVHRGRNAAVFAAIDERSGRRVALKALGERFARDPAVRQRFVTDAQVAAQLDGHPHIVRVHGWGQHGNTIYFVTDFIDGVSLAEVLSRRGADSPMAAVEALPLLSHVGDALDFAHRRGVLHRDVRPANVMVSMSDTARSAYLTDFGIIKDDGASRPGPPGAFLGSPEYSSPEQISASAALDRRADVYSLACMAFEMLAGRPPYAGAPNDAARLAAHLQGPIPSVRAMRPELPIAVGPVFEKALAKRPDDRYSSAGEFVHDLRSVFPLAGADATRPTLTPAGAAPILAPRPSGAEGDVRRRWPVAAAALVAVALVAGAIVLLTGGSDGSTASDTTDVPSTAERPTTTSPTIAASPTTERPPATTIPTTTSPITAPIPVTTPAPSSTQPVVIGPFGFPVGAEVVAGDSPESAFAVHVQNRTVPTDVVVPGSPAEYYAAWIRAAGPATSGAVVATDDGFAVMADRPVELRSFVMVDGRVGSFDECIGDVCTPLEANVTVPADCEPGDGCPHIRSADGLVMAYQRAVITQRWPAQVVVYELVVDPGSGRSIASVEEPTQQHFHYDAATQMFTATFPDRPTPGTRTELLITLDDGSSDSIRIFYGS